MIKSTKKNSQKEKLSNVQTSNLKKITKQKSKIPLEKKNSSSKPKLNTIKVTKNITESKFCPKRNHNSISSKEDVNIKFASKSNRNKFKPNNIVYNNTCGNTNISNNNKLFTSNLFLTNDTDIPIPDEEKKILKKSKFINNEEKILNLPEIDPMFNKKTFKKTIIIDTDGNNNLHMNIKKGENDYKQLLNNKNNNSIFSSSINANTETNSLFTNDSKFDYSKNYNNNNFNINNDIIKEREMKNNIIIVNNDSLNKGQNEEEKRISEYTKIINLLNTNIEQFKKMIGDKNKPNNNNNNKISEPKEKNQKKINTGIKNQKILKQKSKNILINNKKITHPKLGKKSTTNFSIKNKQKSREKSPLENSPTKLKKNFSEKNLSSSSKRIKTNQNIFTVDVRNDIEKELNSGTKIERKDSNNAISSFLESSIQDEFYQSLINQNFLNIEEEKDKNQKDDIISINIDEKGKDENIQDIQDSKIFRGKCENGNINIDNNKIEEKNFDKLNCFIF